MLSEYEILSICGENVLPNSSVSFGGNDDVEVEGVMVSADELMHRHRRLTLKMLGLEDCIIVRLCR